MKSNLVRLVAVQQTSNSPYLNTSLLHVPDSTHHLPFNDDISHNLE